MNTSGKDLNSVDSGTAKTPLIRSMTARDIPEIMGLTPQAYTGSAFNTFKSFFTDHIGDSLVAVEPRSQNYPNGLLVGYALLKKRSGIFEGQVGLSNLFVHPDCNDADKTMQTLIEKSGRVCMARGQDKMNVLVVHDSSQRDSMMAVCQHFNAACVTAGESFNVFAIDDLSGKFGYGAEKKARELKL